MPICTTCTTRTGCICQERLEEIERDSQLQLDIDEANAYERQCAYEKSMIESEIY